VTSKEARRHPVVVASAELYAAIARTLVVQPGDWHDQIARCVLSVGSNWCEGIGRRGTAKSSLSFFRIARGSGYEAALTIVGQKL
jgi:four helix bundle protein